ncbi:hypothetical protein ACOSQ3_020451 [Xanthoceras sorbifolium]
MASPSNRKATIIDGKAIAQTIRSEIADEVRLLSHKYGKVPGLAVVIVGNRKDSQNYVNMKRKACAEVGIKSFDIDLPEQVSEADMISKLFFFFVIFKNANQGPAQTLKFHLYPSSQ